MTQGNLAYKYGYVEEENYKKQNIDKAPGQQRKVRTKKISYAAKVASVLTVAVSAVFMITQFVEVNDSLSAMKTAQKQYAFEEAVTAQKAFELEQSIDLSKIEQEATVRLRMQRPDSHQIVYIDIPQEDVTEKTSGEVEGFRNRIQEWGKSLLSNIVDFFSI